MAAVADMPSEATLTGLHPVARMFGAMHMATRRSMRQFAEEEIVLPEGPRKGLHFSCEFMPFMGLVLDVFDSDLFWRFWGSGPVQSGKTLLFVVIPLMYHLFEMEENVIFGAPELSMAQETWVQDVLPVIERSRYADLLPVRGAGSQGGTPRLSIRFRNGATLRFMCGRGGDEKRSSYTAPVLVMTEVDRMDEVTVQSREADPLRQMENRTRSFMATGRARVYAECTMTIKTGRVHQEVVEWGTDSRLYGRCPRCKVWVSPKREDFAGWEDKEDIITAGETGRTHCPGCGVAWTEGDRSGALETAIIAHKGQQIGPRGGVTGPVPRTQTFGFRWNAIFSPLLRQQDIATTEWRADRADTDEARKWVIQHTWAEPWELDMMDLSDLTRDLILSKVTKRPRGTVPKNTQALVGFIDLGLYQCWWNMWAFWVMGEGVLGHLVDFGCIEVPHGREKRPEAILAAMRTFRDDTLEQGWQMEGAQEVVKHRLCLVDAGYQPDITQRFVRESGARRYMASVGQGSAKHENAVWKQVKKGKGRVIGNHWAMVRQPDGRNLLHMHSDHWKGEVHDGFAAPAGAAGSMTLPDADRHDLADYARQIMAEEHKQEYVPGKGLVYYWDRVNRMNHDLDCAYGARCGADVVGVRPAPPATPAGAGGGGARSGDSYAERKASGKWTIGR